jgi:hypothetical protein
MSSPWLMRDEVEQVASTPARSVGLDLQWTWMENLELFSFADQQ